MKKTFNRLFKKKLNVIFKSENVKWRTRLGAEAENMKLPLTDPTWLEIKRKGAFPLEKE